MRICLVDTLNERHVTTSLARALSARGHDVLMTGPVWHGWRLPNEAEDRARLAVVVDGVIDMRPDVVLAIRSAALRPEQVDRLRANKIFTVAWFSDDPVLYKIHTARVAPHYDVTLHTATAPTLEMYEFSLGVRGLAFPFWTDETAFPRSYDARRCDLDLVFIGNTQTRVKRWRYDWIADLPMSRAIYGEVADDPAGIHAGVAPDDRSLARACVRGRWGLNISQRFVDYAGTRFDFPGFADLGEYSMPSRIVQLAALGVPTVSLVGSEQAAQSMARLFPPVVSVRAAAELTALVTGTCEDLEALHTSSADMHTWFSHHYTASARARFLEQVIAAPRKWTKLTAARRATAFLDVPDGRRAVDKLVFHGIRTLRAVGRRPRRAADAGSDAEAIG